ncbi:bifunctional DNA-formamidopyrimidine glycosylase/DNA-(apurinic or apyrimidinic site) lyase [Ancylobacter sonchi]|uniref:bifunctional DNA-formamidopyrimidine glycosylase/DNA-(apurinic or apyrimidinic site) lyase n=1 Tax=Ancylobacter sonchi TaxID=1937790 RepID=UPI001BD3A012|nr:bifunctional DNA-formamidopyrimidine glycosylase/DNA-(apurinic or apyrimidinic site) lyase [Ancylobacter sonchi]MBS7537124.1 bifunctional DNA-formamidopyrimidine glycosylase/DNA-(apurinic or apyrimidinic site) lyase [Ancylobacter sonchi]
MPELPEVETVRRGLAPVMEGMRLVEAVARRPDLRWPLPERFAERLAGRRVAGLGRRAKYLVADLEATNDQPAEALVMHLGMSGSFRIELPETDPHAPGAFALPRSKAAAHDHVEFGFESGARIVYNDPRRFGAMLLVPRDGLEEHPLFRDLGPEPLGNAFDAATLAAACAGRRSPIKAVLLDQTVVAGLGNIYVCEALHRAGIAPDRMAASLVGPIGQSEPGIGRIVHPTGPIDRLVTAIREVLEEAIRAGGSTLRDHAQVDGTLGYFQHSFRAYGRAGEACLTPGCGGAIERLVQSGRSTFHCTSCQK